MKQQCSKCKLEKDISNFFIEKKMEEFREKWGRFYYSETVGIDWEKPKEILHKSGIMCIASDEIEKDIRTALTQQLDELKRKIEWMKTKKKNKHLCPFNDGKQNCECYLSSFSDILTLIDLMK